MKHILLVEDDPEITALLKIHFESQAYKFFSCSSGEESKKIIATENFHLIILDIALPGVNGMELCKIFRQQDAAVPIMMLTARGEESDKVLALELGADDYVTKPFGILELMARTKALLRRSNHQTADETSNQLITFKELTIDSIKRKASIRNERLDLTPKEFDLLLLLARNRGKTYSRHELLELIWGVAFSGYEHTITSHINRLRIKIESHLQEPQYILTSWGIGYRFSE